jgi:cytidylate kinase
MYRTVTWGLKKAAIHPSNDKKVQDFLKDLEIFFDASNHIWLNGEDVSVEIRTGDISSRVSAVSAIPEVRERMVKIQRQIAGKKDCVLEGRDIGTVVFPDAEYKFFLVADTEIRAKRRLLDLERMGESSTLAELIDDIERRDAIDSSRDHSPLLQAEDAIPIDTSHLTINEQINKIVNLINQ